MKTTFFLLDCCGQRLVCRDQNYLLEQSPSLYAHLIKIATQKKMNTFERFICADTGNTILNTKRTISKAAFSTDQAIAPCALYSQVCLYVGMGNSNKSTLLHVIQGNKLSSFGAALIIQVAQSFIPWNTTLAFCVIFGKFSAFYFLWKVFGSSLYSKQPLFHSTPPQFLGHQNVLALWLCTLWRTIWVILNIPNKQNSQHFSFLYICKVNN